MTRCPALLLVLVLSPGCAAHERERIPTYPPIDARQSLQAMRARSAEARNISGQGAITLSDRRGKSARLDAAFVLAPPDRARVRAWKLGQAVLDVTVRPDGTWLFLPQRDAERAEQARAASETMSRVINQCLLLLFGRLDAPGADVRESGDRILVTEAAVQGLTLNCEIDRATLTARRCTLSDSAGAARFTLMLDRYQTVGPTVWPSRIDARSESGRVLIETREVELNVAPESAFVPPARAVKAP